MVDFCSTKQISTIVLALIGFSILVFFVEEYTEENEMQSEMEMKKDFYKREHDGTTKNEEKTLASVTGTAYPIEECWKHEEFVVVSKCAPCKDFEIQAIKADHCLKTGYFDRINCTKSNTTILRACRSPKEERRRQFYVFSIFNFIVLVVSYLASTKRKAVLDGYLYSRLPTHW